MPIVSDLLSVATEPAGATIYLTRLTLGEPSRPRQRQRLGVTPIERLEIARGSYLLAIELEGYAPVERPISGFTDTLGRDRFLSPPVRVVETLLPASAVPDRMVFVPGGDYRLVAWGRPTDTRPKLADYFIDKYEVSNQDYREFIRPAGTSRRNTGSTRSSRMVACVSWEDAMKTFIDRTGLPGPRGWSQQGFPPALADHPVTGVSWYEAAAYAAFEGKNCRRFFSGRRRRATATRPRRSTGCRGARCCPAIDRCTARTSTARRRCR